MGYSKRIICDIDDTISVTLTRDWQNAEPIWPVINKLNKLYDQGWEIWLVTARGQLSCNGDSQKADKKYRKGIEKWLQKHGVKYHQLSFQKFLAQYYVDDKAILPEDFVELDIREIKSGWSGAQVEKRGDRIFKTHPSALNEAKWYTMASPLVNTPKVHSIIGETICLEFLNSSGHSFKLEELNKNIETFSLYKTYNPFKLYIDRVFKHCKTNDDFYDIIPLLEKEEKTLDQFKTFMHGDLSLENIIQTEKGLFLIDPIWKEDQWSSYLLDITKMMHSFRKHHRMFEYEVFMNTWLKSDPNLSQYILQLLEITQFIRVVSYIPDETMKKEYKTMIKKMIKDIIKDKRLK